MKEYLIDLLGFSIIWAAILLKRGEESELPVFSKYWFLAVALVVLGLSILKATL